jgi:hypothetical protein
VISRVKVMSELDIAAPSRRWGLDYSLNLQASIHIWLLQYSTGLFVTDGISIPLELDSICDVCELLITNNFSFDLKLLHLR